MISGNKTEAENNIDHKDMIKIDLTLGMDLNIKNLLKKTPKQELQLNS